MEVQQQVELDQVELDSVTNDVHLRSTREVVGYHIQAKDGELGHVEDFLVDDHTWAIRYAIVDTSNWWLGNKVLLAVEWIDDVSWQDGHVSVDVPRHAVKDAPTYQVEFPPQAIQLESREIFDPG